MLLEFYFLLLALLKKKLSPFQIVGQFVKSRCMTKLIYLDYFEWRAGSSK